MICRSLKDSTLAHIRDRILSGSKFDVKQTEKFANMGTLYLTKDGFNVVKWIDYDFQGEYCSFELSDGSHKPDKLKLGYILYKENELQPALKRLIEWATAP